MKIGFIGAGTVGTAFGIYLKKNGYAVAGYCSRSMESCRNAAEMTESSAYDNLSQLAADSDIIFITTKDDQIESVCRELCQKAQLREGQFIIHMSGALSSDILSIVKDYGCFAYSMHPLLAFADIEKSAADLPKAYFCIEGGQEKLHVIEELLKTCGNPYFKLKPEQKTLYHAAACMLSNFLVTLVHNGINMMEHIEIDRTIAFEAMLPLMNNTLQNILELGTANALTGPIARGDISTVTKQLDAISGMAMEQLPLFLFMAQETIKLAKQGKSNSDPDINSLQNIINTYYRK